MSRERPRGVPVVLAVAVALIAGTVFVLLKPWGREPPAAVPILWATASVLTAVELPAQVMLHPHPMVRSAEMYVADVQPIVARRCSQCHDAGDPIPLMVFGEARPRALATGEVIQSKAHFDVHMKGGKATYPKRGELRVLRSWIRGGGPRGKPTPTPSRGPIS